MTEREELRDRIRRHAAAATNELEDDLLEVLATIARLEGEAVAYQNTIDGLEHLNKRLQGVTSVSLLDRLSEAEAENARLRETLDTTDYNKLGKIGQAALDVCLPILKSHWAGSVSASMNPNLEYLDVRMGQAAIKAVKTLTKDLTNG